MRRGQENCHGYYATHLQPSLFFRFSLDNILLVMCELSVSNWWRKRANCFHSEFPHALSRWIALISSYQEAAHKIPSSCWLRFLFMSHFISSPLQLVLASPGNAILSSGTLHDVMQLTFLLETLCYGPHHNGKIKKAPFPCFRLSAFVS